MERTKKPWWRMTRTPTSGFVLAGVFTVMALLRWFSWAPGDQRELTLACLFTVTAAAYLASATAMLRRERAAGRTRRA
ncbi:MULTISPECIES: hypothetical protein [unclassified Cellulomonas]|uniref:hypothetical protein n=1 Tax=unclassified Cellulomonas TaxID=2620175 RepID=UPI0024B79D75|nr:hypothetical protein [Cellulomonas sp. ES6]WHP17839.1 hypothetical protein P9841_01320 [Cellulomonas sp. ES6]